MSEAPLRVLQFFRCSNRYGASICIRNQVHELKRRGHEVSIISDISGSLACTLKDEGLRTIDLPPHHKLSPLGILRLREALRRERPDVLHTHLSKASISGTIAAKFARVPSLATVHGMNRRYTYSFADRVIAVSEAGRRDLIRQGLQPSKVVVAHNGIPMPELPSISDRLKAKAALGIPGDALVIGSVTRLAPGKGIDDALTAFAKLKQEFPSLRLVLAGEGSCTEQLQRQASDCGLSDDIHFLGYCEDVESVVAAFDLFVLPSHSEGLPLCILEAMALGVPVVATKVGGIPEVIDERSGLMVPVQDPLTLAAAAKTILADGNLRASMGAYARERAERHFSLQASCDALETAYLGVLKSHGFSRAPRTQFAEKPDLATRES